MPLKLFLLRHGQTDYNLNKCVQGGGTDSDLNAIGREQANKFAEKYQNIVFEKVYVSGLKRTRQTIEPFHFDKISQLEDLNEIHWGVLEGKSISDEVIKQIAEINKSWYSGDLRCKIEGGESPLEVQERIMRAFEQIYRECPSGNALICTHGRTLRVILSTLLNQELRLMNQFLHENTGLNLLTRANSDTVFIPELLNDISHLQ